MPVTREHGARQAHAAGLPPGPGLAPVDVRTLDPPAGNRIPTAGPHEPAHEFRTLGTARQPAPETFGPRAARDQIAAGFAGQERVERRRHLIPVHRGERQALVAGFTADLKREGRVRQRGPRERGGAAQPSAPRLDRGAQPPGVARGKDHQMPLAGGPGVGRRGRSLLDDDVGVGAAGAEGTEAGPARERTAGPRHGRLRDVERRRGEVEVRVERARMEARRDDPVAQLQQQLEEPGEAGRPLEVAEVGLHRAERARGRRAARAAEDFLQRGHLDGIAEGGAGPVRLEARDLRRRDPRRRQRGPHHRGLRPRVRHGVAVGFASVIHGRRPQDAVHGVAVRQGTRQRLQQHRGHALPGHVTVPAGPEALAPAVRGREPALRQADVLRRVQREVNAAGQRQFAFAAPQARACEVQRGQGRGAHRVEREARAAPVEPVGDPVRDRGLRGVDGHEPSRRRGLQAHELVLAVHRADEDAHRPAPQLGARVTRILHRVPRRLEEQPFLRVDQLRLARGHPEKPGIEAVDVREEAAPAVVGLPGGPALRRVVVRQRPALRRHLGDRIAAGGQQGPQRLRIRRLREAAVETDHSHGIRHLGRCGSGGDARRCGLRRVRGGTHGSRHRHRRAHERPQGPGVTNRQVRREGREGLVLVEERLGQRTEILLQPPREGEHEQRIDAVTLERGRRVDALHGNLGQRRQFPPQIVRHGRRRHRCTAGHGRLRRTARRVRDHLQRRRPRGHRFQSHRDHRLLPRQQPREHRAAQRRRQRFDPLAAQRQQLRRHAQARLPQRPLDRHASPRALARQHAPRAAPQKRVEEGIGVGVVRLPHVAVHRGHRAEAREPPQRIRRRRLVEHHHPRGLRRQHAPRRIQGLTHEKRIRGHARRVDHAFHRAELRARRRQRRPHGSRVRDICHPVPPARPGRERRCQPRGRLHAPPEQRERGTLRRQFRRHRAAHPARAAT